MIIFAFAVSFRGAWWDITLGTNSCGSQVSLVMRLVFIKVTDDQHQQRISFVTMKPRGDKLYRGADKSLAPTRKETSCSNQTLTFANHSKKKCRNLSVQPDIRGSNDVGVGRKMATFQLFFFSRAGLRTYQHPCTSQWVDQPRVILPVLTVSSCLTRVLKRGYRFRKSCCCGASCNLTKGSFRCVNPTDE